MKKIIVAVLAVLAFSVAASAQPKAIGIRAGWGGEISYQHWVGGSNFVEADLGLVGHGFYLTGAYNFNIGNAGDFNFYAGPGAQIGMSNYRDSENNVHSRLGLAVVGQIGAEYNFPGVPINISLDWRPALYLLNGIGFGWQGFALGLRYNF